MPDPHVRTITLSRAAKKDFDRLDVVVARRIGTAIDALANDPRPPGCLKIASEVGIWRIRVGDYRVA